MLFRQILKRQYQVTDRPARDYSLRTPEDAAMFASMEMPNRIERLIIAAIVRHQSASIGGRESQLIFV